MMDIKIEGLDELLKFYEHQRTGSELISDMRSTVNTVAGKAAKDIRKGAPRDDKGRLSAAKNVRARSRRPKDGFIFADVISEKKTFFWRFVEHGTSTGQKPQPFVQPVRDRLAQTLPVEVRRVLIKRITKQIAKVRAK